MSLRRSDPYPRRHGVVLEPATRRRLERDGWRTTLDYRENHVRARNGCLIEIQPCWTAEAERFDGSLVVATATGATPDEAWDVLSADIDADRVRSTGRIRIVRPGR